MEAISIGKYPPLAVTVFWHAARNTTQTTCLDSDDKKIVYKT
jgi:hypothetical protein